jgi:hypothetical protein
MSRWRVTFWLDDQKTEDVEVGKIVLDLKRKRQFISTVRAGLRLVTSLRAGDTSVLFELFPHLAETLKPAPSAPNSGDLERLIQNTIQASVKQAVLELPSLPAGELVAAPVKKPSAPVLETKAAPLADANAICDNFLAFLQ